MIIYNVTVKVNVDAADDWATWMTTEHIADVVNTGLFTGSRICRLLEQDELEGVTYVVQYYCDSMALYNTYIDKYAEGMRNKAFAAFGGKFVAFRSVMEVIG